MKVCDALRRALEHNQWTQLEAAAKTGVEPKTISRIITGGTTRATARTIGKLRSGIPGFSELLDTEHAVA